jgi:tRNA1(Val) A37 N6-methylase TrmN6
MTIHKNTNSAYLEVVKYEETCLLDGRVVCLQTKNGYRAAIDPVFLAAAIDANGGDRVLDVGSGTGAASLCLAARVQGVEITGIEIQPEYAEMARKSAVLTGVENQINFITADLRTLPKSGNLCEFDHVMTNPPYIVAGQGRLPPDKTKAQATFESNVALDQWISHCLRMTRSRGIFTIIHRADRLEHIMASISGILGNIVVFPLWPSQVSRDKNTPISANRIIISGRKGVKSPGVLSSGITLHEGKNGRYTSEANNILMHASLLRLNN